MYTNQREYWVVLAGAVIGVNISDWCNFGLGLGASYIRMLPAELKLHGETRSAIDSIVRKDMGVEYSQDGQVNISQPAVGIAPVQQVENDDQCGLSREVVREDLYLVTKEITTYANEEEVHQLAIGLSLRKQSLWPDSCK